MISAEIVHSRYKDLGLIKGVFRDMKTEHLKIRLVNVQKENHTRCHVFIVIFAYLIWMELERCWQEVEITIKEGIDELSQLCSVLMKYDVERFQSISSTYSLGKKLLKLAGMKLPDNLPLWKKNVYTRKKIARRRKVKK